MKKGIEVLTNAADGLEKSVRTGVGSGGVIRLVDAASALKKKELRAKAAEDLQDVVEQYALIVEALQRMATAKADQDRSPEDSDKSPLVKLDPSKLSGQQK